MAESEKVVTPINDDIIGTLNDLLGASIPDVRKVFIKTLGTHVFLRIPTARARGLFEASVAAEDRHVESMKMRLCSIALCDENGKLFIPSMDGAAKHLGSVGSDVIEEIAGHVREMIRIQPEDVDEAEKK